MSATTRWIYTSTTLVWRELDQPPIPLDHVQMRPQTRQAEPSSACINSHLLALHIAGSHFRRVDLIQPQLLQSGLDCCYHRATSDHDFKCLCAQLVRDKARPRYESAKRFSRCSFTGQPGRWATKNHRIPALLGPPGVRHCALSKTLEQARCRHSTVL